jgi:hypothetical protein
MKNRSADGCNASIRMSFMWCSVSRRVIRYSFFVQYIEETACYFSAANNDFTMQQMPCMLYSLKETSTTFEVYKLLLAVGENYRFSTANAFAMQQMLIKKMSSKLMRFGFFYMIN